MTKRQPDLPGLPAQHPKKKITTWVTRFDEAFKRKIGMPPNRGKLMRELKLVREHTGHDYDTIFTRFKLFLNVTPARYCSATYFRTSYTRWTSAGLARFERALEVEQESQERLRENLAAPREAKTDPAAVGSLIVDLERHGREVPSWLQKAKEDHNDE